MVHPALLRPAVLAALVSVVWTVHGVSGWASPRPTASSLAAAALAAAPPASEDAAAVHGAIRFLENKLRGDPDDADAYNRLGAYHLRLLRETGSVDDLRIALHAAHASLRSVPAVRNTNGLTNLALAEFASHDFAGARDHARRLARLDPARSAPYAILGDALAELGDYDGAARAYAEMTRRSAGISVNAEPRLARMSFLHGDIAGAERRYSDALAAASTLTIPPRETIAWCEWQLGELAFADGRYDLAEAHDRDALASFPGYFRALASLGRARAARGDTDGAIEAYAEAIRRFPDPTFVAALGDLYALTGRRADAEAQYALVETIGRLSTLNGVLYNRQLALFRADHGVMRQAAYADAKREYGVRRDVYGADALAWTALKAGRLAEARRAAREALHLGTQDARVFYHAGMVARAAGDHEAARENLRRALALSPQFDPLQAPIARATLAAEEAART